MAYKNKIKQIQEIIKEVICLYEKNYDTLDLEDLAELLFFRNLNEILNNYIKDMY